MSSTEQKDSRKCISFIWDAYSEVLRPFLIKLYNWKFGENWQFNIPYDGYNQGTFREEFRMPSDLAKADANKLLSYLVYIRKNNTYEAERFYNSKISHWPEISHKNLFINNLQNAIYYRNYFFHPNGEKIERDFYEVTFDDVTKTVLGILKIFSNIECLKADNGESYYELALKICKTLQEESLYPISLALNDLSEISFKLSISDAKKIFLDKGFSFDNENNIVVLDHNKYVKALSHIKATHISCEKIRKELGVTNIELSNQDIKLFCFKKKYGVAFYSDEIIAFETEDDYRNMLSDLSKKNKKPIYVICGIIITLLTCIVFLIVNIVFNNKKNIYINDDLKNRQSNEELTFNITKVIYEDEYLYCTFVVDNWINEYVSVNNPNIIITAENNNDESIFVLDTIIDEVWEISPKGNKIMKKILIDNKKQVDEFDENGIKNLSFEIQVQY